MVCRLAAEVIDRSEANSRYDAVIVDEVQDLGIHEVTLTSSLCRAGLQNLMLVGDAGQRIYPGGFSLRSLGIETRGRSRRLTVNYRTTVETMRAADKLRSASVEDMEGGQEEGRSPIALVRGKKPVLVGFSSFTEEHAFVVEQITKLIEDGCSPKDIGVLARERKPLWGITKAMEEHGLECTRLEDSQPRSNAVRTGTLHSAKGLEFRFVFIVKCRSNQMPNLIAISAANGDARLVAAATARERSLLYMAIMRARERVWITWSGQPSPFVSELRSFAECPCAIPTN